MAKRYMADFTNKRSTDSGVSKEDAKQWMVDVTERRKLKRPDLRSAPLRTVVEKDVMVDVSPKPEEYAMEIPRWKLECGHLVSPPQDIYGERFPKRMRCGQCAADQLDAGELNQEEKNHGDL